MGIIKYNNKLISDDLYLDNIFVVCDSIRFIQNVDGAAYWVIFFCSFLIDIDAWIKIMGSLCNLRTVSWAPRSVSSNFYYYGTKQ